MTATLAKWLLQVEEFCVSLLPIVAVFVTIYLPWGYCIRQMRCASKVVHESLPCLPQQALNIWVDG